MLGLGTSGVCAGASGAAAGGGVAVVIVAGAAGFGADGATGMVACACIEISKVRGVDEADASFCSGSKPNISTVYLQDVEGRPPISKRPLSSLVVVILLSVPHSAETVAPGIGCPPERATPVCTSAAATPANISKKRQVERSMKRSPLGVQNGAGSWIDRDMNRSPRKRRVLTNGIRAAPHLWSLIAHCILSPALKK